MHVPGISLVQHSVFQIQHFLHVSDMWLQVLALQITWFIAVILPSSSPNDLIQFSANADTCSRG